MNSVNKRLFKASPPGRFGGATLQAAALIVIAASAIVAAAMSHQKVHEKCNHEWEISFDKNNSVKDSNFLSNADFLHQLK